MKPRGRGRVGFTLIELLVVIAIATARFIQNSRVGRGLQALRDDELAAECTGVPTLRLKLLACGISGALMAAAGAPSAMYLQYADPSSAFNLNYSVSVLAMSLIGGTAHWIGPVLGAKVPRTQMAPSSRWGRNSEPITPPSAR